MRLEKNSNSKDVAAIYYYIGKIFRHNIFDIYQAKVNRTVVLLDNEADIDNVLQASKAGRPVLINALIGKTTFRNRSISM